MLKNKKTSPLESIKRQISAHGFTNFVDGAKTHLKTLDPESHDYAILSFLIEHAVGIKNARNWKAINSHLRKQGHRITKNKFQTGLLQDSRSSPFFICSYSGGYFLVGSASDAQVTLDFYHSRVTKEQAHMGALEFLAARAQFEDPGTGPEEREDRAA